MSGKDFQIGVDQWMDACFGEPIKSDSLERADRLTEEALELVQTVPGFTADRAHALVDYVFGRPVGERGQEVGGTMVCLAALCNTFGISMSEEGDRELARIWTKVEQIRAKQAAKPTGSALPMAGDKPADQPGDDAYRAVTSATNAWAAATSEDDGDRAAAQIIQTYGDRRVEAERLRAEQAEKKLAEKTAVLEKCRAQFKFYADEHAVKSATALKAWEDARYWGNVAEQDATRKEYEKRFQQTETNHAFVTMIDAALTPAEQSGQG